MAKTVDKISEGLKEAIESAKCEHDLQPQPHLGSMRRFYCPKCGVTIWKPPLHSRSR